MSQASDLFRQNDDEGLLKALRMAGLSGQLDRVEELTVKFSEHQEQLEEVHTSIHTLSPPRGGTHSNTHTKSS